MEAGISAHGWSIEEIVELLDIAKMGIPDDADQCSGACRSRFRDDGDHDSGMMPITRSGMIPIS
jgi:hypothetical protein